MTESRADLLLALLRERWGADAELHDQGVPNVDEITLPEGHEYCTTWSRRRRHVSAELKADAYGKGRAGRTLCNESGDDQARVNHYTDTYGTRALDVASLPLCGRCSRSLAKVVRA